MKCAIYARVSTDEQGTSIVNQQEYFKEYIKRNNYEIYDIYSDEAFSGTESSKRLSFQRLLEDGKNKRYDVLLAKSYSRFGRNQRETLTALAELFEHNIRIIFVEDGLDSLKDKGMFGLFAWLSEQESRKISERIKLTWTVYNKEGKIHSPSEPYGYNYDTAIKNFVVNAVEAETVRMIYDMYLQGAGANKIATYLNDNGYPTKRSGSWSAKVIWYIVTNDFYLGHLTQGKCQRIDVVIKKREKIDKSKWHVHKNHHEAIITEDVFCRAQEEFARRSEYLKQCNPIRHSSAHTFSNLVKCKVCGSPCFAKRRRTGADDFCYTCKAYEFSGANGCGHSRNAINENDLLLNLKAELNRLAENDYKTVRDYYKQINDDDKQREQPKINIAVLEKQIAEQTRLGNSLLSLYIEGTIGDEQFKLQNNAIAERIKVLAEQKERILLEQNNTAVNVDKEKETIKSIRNLKNADISDWTNEMIKKVVNEISLNMFNNEINIAYNYTIAR